MKAAKTVMILVVVLLMAGSLAAQEMMEKKMELSAEQKTKVAALKHEWKRAKIDLEAKIEIAKLDLHYAMHDAESTAKDVKKKAEALAGAKSKKIMAHAEHHNKVRALFSKEEWGKMHSGMDCPMCGGGGKREKGDKCSMKESQEKKHQMMEKKEITIEKEM